MRRPVLGVEQGGGGECSRVDQVGVFEGSSRGCVCNIDQENALSWNDIR